MSIHPLSELPCSLKLSSCLTVFPSIEVLSRILRKSNKTALPILESLDVSLTNKVNFDVQATSIIILSSLLLGKIKLKFRSLTNE